MTKATDLIAAERERQVTEEGYTVQHDAGHTAQLAQAAASYATNTAQIINGLPSVARGQADFSEERFWWPWHRSYWKPTGDPVRDLVKAGALIAAAIDSLVSITHVSE